MRCGRITQESKTRAEVISLLIDDFEVTQDELDVAIESAQTHFEKNTRLLEIISTERISIEMNLAI